ncbi:helix-turn-helix transcriptional regulator [Slackia exigua]|uniref:helix-turn-helix transcriptional regulator n=1 Tax=Slackia exigua TaxID=84109 RepID=UPI0028D31201|nr:helix-turn-helix transcriptional regulator [Slackia exigua]
MKLLKRSIDSFDGYTRELSSTMKFRFLGLGFLWAWIYVTWFTPVLFPASTGMTINNDISWFVSSATVTPTLFLMPIALGDREISTIPFVPALAGPLTSLGAVLMCSEALFGVKLIALSVVGGIITGIASGWLWMLAGEFTGQVDQELSELFVPLCVAVPAVVMLGTMFISGPAAGLAICLLPMIAGLLLLLSLKDQDVIHPVELLNIEDRPHYMRDFVRVGIGSLALYTCIGFSWGAMDYGALISWGDSHLVWYEIGAIAAIAIAVLSISYASRLDLFSLYRGLIPVLLLGLVMLTFPSAFVRSISLTFLTCAQYVYDVVIWIYFSRVVRRGVCSGSLAIGINRGFVQAGVVLGNLLALAVPSLIRDGKITFTFITFLLSVVATSLLLLILSRTDKLERIMKNATSVPIESTQIDYDAVCDKLAGVHGLTTREREILGYLVRGRSLPYIRDTLVLSKNTVGTHVRNLYKKLDVHSRQELLDLIEAESS